MYCIIQCDTPPSEGNNADIKTTEIKFVRKWVTGEIRWVKVVNAKQEKQMNEQNIAGKNVQHSVTTVEVLQGQTLMSKT